MTLKEALESGYCSLDDEFDFDDTPQGEEIACLKLEIERLKKREQECIDHYLVQCKYASEMEDKYITANYVINELERLLQQDLKNELQELKGSDK